ncbi:hypothetical protein OUZ56_005103 [Daphnia magna]|uniref:Uncharacterized protein n=1 Tax=Daphnia magna TaxID=35525 RepID=A0ABQ9YRW2_9CRUS|nr:hypothetical protein OUZ56_005103 [Daphnia magna]
MQHHYRNGSPDGQPVPPPKTLLPSVVCSGSLPLVSTNAANLISLFPSAFYGDLKPSDSSPTFLKPVLREISVVGARSNGNTSRHFLQITQLFARRHCYNVDRERNTFICLRYTKGITTVKIRHQQPTGINV